jgi:hypothetical protein
MKKLKFNYFEMEDVTDYIAVWLTRLCATYVMELFFLSLWVETNNNLEVYETELFIFTFCI